MVRPLRLFALLAALASLAFAGCAHYHAGAPAAPGFSSIYVAPVANATFAPQAAALVTTQVREALARDGRVPLAGDAPGADVRLAVKLTAYDRDVAAVRHDDTGRARKYAVALTAEVTLTDRAGKALVDRRPVRVVRDVFLDSGQQPTEYQTLPLLANALATEITHVVLDTW